MPRSERVHAKGREKAAGRISINSIKLGWANIDLWPWRSSGSRPGNSLPNVFPIHGEIGDPAICRIDEVMGGITAMNGVPCSTLWHEWVTEDNAVVLGSRNHGAVPA